MKIRTDFVSNSSSSSFMVNNKSSIRKLYHFLEKFNESESFGATVTIVLSVSELCTELLMCIYNKLDTDKSLDSFISDHYENYNNDTIYSIDFGLIQLIPDHYLKYIESIEIYFSDTLDVHNSFNFASILYYICSKILDIECDDSKSEVSFLNPSYSYNDDALDYVLEKIDSLKKPEKNIKNRNHSGEN